MILGTVEESAEETRLFHVASFIICLYSKVLGKMKSYLRLQFMLATRDHLFDSESKTSTVLSLSVPLYPPKIRIVRNIREKVHSFEICTNQ